MSVEAKAREIEKRRSSKGLRTVTTGRCFEKNVLESLFASLIALMYTSESVISCVFRSLLRKRHHVSSYHSLCVLQLLSSLIHFPFSLVYRFVCVSATSSLILLSVFCVFLFQRNQVSRSISFLFLLSRVIIIRIFPVSTSRKKERELFKDEQQRDSTAIFLSHSHFSRQRFSCCIDFCLFLSLCHFRSLLSVRKERQKCRRITDGERLLFYFWFCEHSCLTSHLFSGTFLSSHSLFGFFL